MSRSRLEQLISGSRLEQLKPPTLVALPEKTKALLVRCMRVGLILCLIASIALGLCSAFSSQSHWFPLLDRNRTRSATSIFSTTGVDSEPPTNISHILFSIGSSVNTWRDRSRYAEAWWDRNTTRGYVWLDAKPENLTNVSAYYIPYRVSGNWTRFKYSHSQSAVRIARVVVDSFNLRLPNVRWFVMGDDDTVFFPHNLVSVLSRYDHNRMYYIGGNSESVEQDVMHAYDMAFGGGGFAISYPLAARLAELMDGCLERYYNMYGSDQRVWACVSETGVSLTQLGGFHQFDIRGDPYGVLAAHPLAPLLSLHHIDALAPIFPNQTHLDSIKSLVHAYRVDPPRILQQSVCYDRRRKWTVSISWGYTLQLYPTMVSALDLRRPLQTFKTWRSWADGPFTFNTRPVSSNPCERPITYFLEHVKDGKSGNTLTTYKRFGHKERECNRTDYHHAMAMQRIVVLSRKMDPQYWTKELAPRRQCSEIKNRASLRGGTMMIKIRRCRPSESITI
ncbi:putative O-fucosylpeptide 3-beta-N-acetylglucosaminyltransferase [Rosa chinensis]|uniref:Putative O-fucosylpeptide 3-beta-N-acetylglucosaminyltransferase n=1 Tax=Rosa chinensis TaxID=74649 RepID=A0A2P6SKS5_ROSCH|nr:uncharacterized protein LOC112176466 [Rosa chinensis]PRQ59263.1 putative O-fucosylpeptide 3-beta-N-acetylglucosaminyltransferase [Rosa chinensis]